MKEKSMKQENESQTLAHRLRRGDKLWIGGHFVQLVKVPLSSRKITCDVCGFYRKCTLPVVKVCVELKPDDEYLYGVGMVRQ